MVEMFFKQDPWFLARKNDAQPMRPYVPGEDMTGISISERDVPKAGGMIAVSPKDPNDRWYINPEFYAENYHLVRDSEDPTPTDDNLKTLHNSDVSRAHDNVPDIVVYGDGDAFQLICKASSKKEGWMKSTKAMEIDGYGCLVQVTTQQWDHVAEALCFVPGVWIFTDRGGNRKLVKMDNIRPPVE